MYAMPDASPQLKAIKHEATQLGGGVLRCMTKLQRIVALARIRHSPMLFIFVYLPLQIVFLYDLHILCLLEAWQSEGRRPRTGLVPGTGQVGGPVVVGNTGPRLSRLGHARGR